MIVLAYLELSGFLQVVERRVLGPARRARGLLLLVVFSSGILSALFMVEVGFLEYLRAGAPVTAATLLIAWGVLALGAP